MEVQQCFGKTGCDHSYKALLISPAFPRQLQSHTNLPKMFCSVYSCEATSKKILRQQFETVALLQEKCKNPPIDPNAKV